MKRYGLFAVMSALVVGTACAQAPSPVGPTLPRRVPDVARRATPAPRAGVAVRSGPRDVLVAFGKAWEAENLSGLLGLFGEARVPVDLGSAARGGQYGPAQLYFQFKRLFERTATSRFALRRLRAVGDSPHAIFDWQYLDEKRGGVQRRVRLIVSLRQDAGAWKVEEIKSVSR